MRTLFVCCFSFIVSNAAVGQTPLRAYPESISFVGPRAQQRIIAVDDADRTSVAKFTSAKPAIATVDAKGIVRPVADGDTVIAVEFGGRTASVPVSVTRIANEPPVNFVREIEPIFTKSSCNSGGCHGSQHGKGGFRLSLFGFDPAFDHAQIVQSAEGRRVVLSEPERSILLQKPALLMEHGGGERLKADSREFRLLKQWLADGAPEPEAKELTVTKLEVYPPHRVIKPGEKQQLVAVATWSDGVVEDVTSTAQYDSLNDAVAMLLPGGAFETKAAGETHIMVRFCGQATVAQVTSPYAKINKYPELPKNNFIDEKLAAKWKDLGLTPSPLCGDDEFLRRLYLDLLGTLPTPEETRQFVIDKSKTKRAEAIDKAMSRPEFVDFWALKWGDLLRINRDVLQDKGMWSFHNWVRASLRDGKPVDEFAREIITAEGSTFTDGPVNFYKIGRNSEEWSETIAQVFLGVRMQCAKCHHHPFEKWSQDDYYGMTAFFTRVTTKNSQEFGIFGGESIVYLRATGEATHPRKRGVVKPHPLDGPTMDDELDRRNKLAEWMTAKENPFFARNIANRFWGYLMGRGLVEPLDDMRATNPASNPELLDALAADFAKAKFDLKHLLKTILNSRAYQLSSNCTDGNVADTSNTHFARYTTKRLTAEQLADALDFVTGTREKYVGVPLGTRAISLPDNRVRSYLMDVFGRPARQVVCECERTTQPNIAQAMHLLNGDFLNKKIADRDGRIEKLLKAKTDSKKAIEELYLATLSRLPEAEEITKAEGWIRSATDQREGLQDLLWTLINSREFLFNH